MAINTVGVLGCGLMGSGIAQVCAGAGYKTIVREVEQGLLDKGLGRINKFLSDGVEKGKVTADAKQKALGNLSGTTKIDDLAGCDIVIEAIIENVEEKAKTFGALEAVVGPHTILCSNTSSLCITELASKTKRPEKFAGLHFFNPVPLMKLVEVIRGLSTSEETYQTVYAFAQSLGKDPITAPDKPGFIVNRLLVPYLLDAVRAYENGLGSIEDIDLLHREHLLRGVPRAPVRAAAAVEAHGARGQARTKVRPGVLQVLTGNAEGRRLKFENEFSVLPCAFELQPSNFSLSSGAPY
jgi:3-hydroxybutyryl-CoA dehydrogenase